MLWAFRLREPIRRRRLQQAAFLQGDQLQIGTGRTPAPRGSKLISAPTEPLPSSNADARGRLDVPVRSMHADPLPIPDQPGGLLCPMTAGKPYSRAITTPWVIRPPPQSPGP